LRAAAGLSRITLETAMARKPNYNFEKRQREIKKQEKKAAKAEAKRQQAEARKEGDALPGSSDEPNS
jgi:hypothetical protein